MQQLAVVRDQQIQFATHIERLTRKKNDAWVPQWVLEHAYNEYAYDKTIFYEHTEIKNCRRENVRNGKDREMAERTMSEIYFIIKSHYASAYFTAPFTPDSTVVIDAIGEFDTASIWVDGEKVWSRQYPWSLGLFYSAITKRIGLKPNEDEYITMGMAAYGDVSIDMMDFINENHHKGIPMRKWFWQTPEDIAASAQAHLENELMERFAKARKYGPKGCICWWCRVNLRSE